MVSQYPYIRILHHNGYKVCILLNYCEFCMNLVNNVNTTEIVTDVNMIYTCSSIQHAYIMKILIYYNNKFKGIFLLEDYL